MDGGVQGDERFTATTFTVDNRHDAVQNQIMDEPQVIDDGLQVLEMDNRELTRRRPIILAGLIGELVIRSLP